MGEDDPLAIVRPQKPRSSTCPLVLIRFVKVLAVGTDRNPSDGVGTKPNSRANVFAMSVGCVSQVARVLVETVRQVSGKCRGPEMYFIAIGRRGCRRVSGDDEARRVGGPTSSLSPIGPQ